MSASYASGHKMDPGIQHILFGKHFPLLLIQEEQVTGYWRKDGH